MTSELEKIDIIRARLGVSYKEARNALEEAGGDVVQALVQLEERNLHLHEKIRHRSKDMAGQVRHLFGKGQSTRIEIKKDGRTVCEFPATVGVIGLLGALYSTELAVLGAVGAVAAMVNNYTIEVKRPERLSAQDAFDYRYYQ